ncbi:MAG: PAS domain-containing protein [Opitutaceae bacterium]
MKKGFSSDARRGGGIFPEILRKRIRKIPIAPDSARGVGFSGIGFWHFEVTTALHFWDEELFRIFGIEPSEGPIGPVRWLDMVHPDDRAQQVAESQACWESKNRSETTYRLVRRDGEVKVVRSFISVERNKDGTPRRLFGCCQDISEQAALMEKLRVEAAAERQGKLQAEKAGRHSLEAMHALGHEIRNPLSLLGGLCHVLALRLEAEGAAELTAYSRRIRAGVSRLNAIIVDLLAFAEQSGAPRGPAAAEFGVAEWVEEMREIVEPMAQCWSIAMAWTVNFREGAVFRANVALASHRVLEFLQQAISDCGELPGEIVVSVSLSEGGDRMVWKAESRVRTVPGVRPGCRHGCGGGWLKEVLGLPGGGGAFKGIRAFTEVRRLSNQTIVRSLTLVGPLRRTRAAVRPGRLRAGRKS